MRVNVGDVILARYMDYNGVVKDGIFAVIYHECIDEITSTNFTALKVCTNERCYQVPLQTDYLPFLDHDSYINCNMQFRFCESQVLDVMGKLNSYYLHRISNQLVSYHNRVISQLEQTIKRVEGLKGEVKKDEV